MSKYNLIKKEMFNHLLYYFILSIFLDNSFIHNKNYNTKSYSWVSVSTTLAPTFSTKASPFGINTSFSIIKFIASSICDSVKFGFGSSTDIDTFMKDKNGKVGFIKADLQGIMHKAVNGMKETIKRDRPVLFLDISDSPQDFFYTKPIIEDILKDLNYTLKITSLNASVSIVGTAIWAYPKELEE